ncbi:MAG: hypothetical protein DME55_05525 [Verrucomicrobia bacterium]|nr:MAG: hypothetical protein DME55_05525 [Verrucomicrobiota bacterium]
MKSSARGAIVAVAICSWFAISNHCAFAALATRTDAASHGCPFHSKPKEKPSAGAQCCKILRAVASVPAKAWARDDTNLSDADDYGGERALAIAYLQTALVPLSLDTGPPGVRSFAELILQRSLLDHAPPVLV